MVVLEHMIQQVMFELESHSSQGTFKRFVIRMNPSVLQHVSIGSESFITNVTGVWSLPCIGSKVNRENGLSSELFLACGARSSIGFGMKFLVNVN
jgi:hypothetical protein